MTELYYKASRKFSRERLLALDEHLAAAKSLAEGKACVYATGSFGRLEAGPYSDLDLFIISEQGKGSKLKLGGIDAIRLKSELIGAVDKLELPPFDGDGKFLQVHPLNDFVKELGSPNDDFKNTLTGRLLLLLESQVLIGSDIFDALISKVLNRYFRDFEGNEANFVPAFIVNDIIRMWRTFCVNYEHWRRRSEVSSKIKNLKLKFNRLLTCYSGLIYILSLSERNGTVTPEDIKRMVSLTPTERLEEIALVSNDDLASALNQSLAIYSDFLEILHQSKVELEAQYPERAIEWRAKSSDFADAIKLCLLKLGVGNEGALQRIILI